MLLKVRQNLRNINYFVLIEQAYDNVEYVILHEYREELLNLLKEPYTLPKTLKKIMYESISAKDWIRSYEDYCECFNDLITGYQYSEIISMYYFHRGTDFNGIIQQVLKCVSSDKLAYNFNKSLISFVKLQAMIRGHNQRWRCPLLIFNSC
jgi:hypothetical protein